jgi:hypothetical protein
MQKLVTLLLLGLLGVAPASAQWEALVSKGLYGDLGFSAGSTEYKSDCCGGGNHSKTFFGVKAGFLPSSKFGVGLELQSEKEENSDANLFISPRLIAVPIRQGEKYPVTVSTNLVYHFVIAGDENVDINGFGVDIGISRSIKPLKDIGLLPHATIRVNRYTSSYDAASKGTASDSEYHTTPFGLKLGITGSLKKGPGLITVTPSFEMLRSTEGEEPFERTATAMQFGLKAGITLKK